VPTIWLGNEWVLRSGRASDRYLSRGSGDVKKKSGLAAD
jgi:hypothetical protein